MASRGACSVTVPGAPSPWPGWSEIAALAGPQVAHAVDGAGAIHLAEWSDGYTVRKDQGGRWEPLGRLRVNGSRWAFAVTPDGRALLARDLVEQANFKVSVSVDVQVLERGNWAPLGTPFQAGNIEQHAQTAGQPALAVDGSGAPLLMFDDRSVDGVPGQTAYLWDLRGERWKRLGSEAFLPTQYAARESSIAPAGVGRLFAMSTWAERVDTNIGCYDDGVRVAHFDGVSWMDLGELKLDRTRSETTACPWSLLLHASLAVDDGGRALVAFTEGPSGGPLAGVHLFRWSGTAWDRQAQWSGADRGSPVSLASVSPGALWLSWTAPEPDGSRVVLYRLDDSGWQLFDELRSPSADLRGSIVCADDRGNPVIAVTDGEGGHLLYHR